jgi:phosphatidylglycerophosphatase A
LTRISPRLLLNPLHLLSLGFGSGLAPLAPGTCGTLVAVPFYLLLAQLSLPWYLLAVAIGFTVGVLLCRYTSAALGVHDHPGIVAVPFAWQWILLGFVLFRVFDIIKPWPVKTADAKMKGGLGIMIDDVLAGLYALACMHLALWVAG